MDCVAESTALRSECSAMKMDKMTQRDLRRVRTKARAVERAERELHAAILQAVAAGESYRDIAPYAGISFSRIYQIVRDAKENARRDVCS